MDRDIKAKKQKFGIELSDLLWDVERKQKTLGGAGGGKSTYLKSLEKEWHVARADLQKIHLKRDDIQGKLDVAKTEQQTRAAAQSDDATDSNKPSFMDKAKEAGTEGKRRTKLQLLERELKARKQQFGIDVDEVAVGLVANKSDQNIGSGSTLTDSKNRASASVTNAVTSSKKIGFVEKQFAKAVVSQVSRELNKLTVNDSDIEKVICAVKADVETVQTKIDSKRTEIENLKQ